MRVRARPVGSRSHARRARRRGWDRPKATLTVGVRHLGLVVALAVGAPLLAGDLVAAADVAKLNATAVIIDGQIPATTKIPVALDIRDELDRAPKGEIPDFSASFEEAGAGTTKRCRVRTRI